MSKRAWRIVVYAAFVPFGAAIAASVLVVVHRLIFGGWGWRVAYLAAAALLWLVWLGERRGWTSDKPGEKTEPKAGATG